MTRRAKKRQPDLFGESPFVLPVFSGTPQRVELEAFEPADEIRQVDPPGMQPDWIKLTQAAQQRKRKAAGEEPTKPP